MQRADSNIHPPFRHEGKSKEGRRCVEGTVRDNASEIESRSLFRTHSHPLMKGKCCAQRCGGTQGRGRTRDETLTPSLLPPTLPSLAEV